MARFHPETEHLLSFSQHLLLWSGTFLVAAGVVAAIHQGFFDGGATRDPHAVTSEGRASESAAR